VCPELCFFEPLILRFSSQERRTSKNSTKEINARRTVEISVTAAGRPKKVFPEKRYARAEPKIRPRKMKTKQMAEKWP
jgi:hypothetical protein